MGISFEIMQQLITDWIIAHGPQVLGILIGAIIVHYFSGYFIERLMRRVVVRGGGDEDAEVRREDTLIQVLHSTIAVVLWIVVLLMVLSELGVAIGPLIAAAGIAGVAVGFGGQYLIRDVITGLFILMENQYRVGDVVDFSGTAGVVEHITLRKTTLRDLDGTVHHIPHGEVTKVANLSKDYARVNLNIGVSYNADLERVMEVVNTVGEELAKDPEWSGHILSAPKFLRVDEFADSAVVIKILGETRPLQQWAVAGEFRKRLKIAFDIKGIEIPFPQRVVHAVKG